MKGHRALHAMIRCATTPFGEPSVVLWRAAALSHAGPFREDYGTLIDVDMYARVLRDWDCVSLDETVAKFRVRAASWSDRSHRVQGRNMRRFINDCAADPANEIGPLLRAQGLGRSVLNQYGRRLAFALHK